MAKEKATIKIRVHPSTRRKLRIEAAKRGLTIGELVAELVGNKIKNEKPISKKSHN